ncbi:MAG: hypothetical protein KAX49_11865 [Halanaerobiales bacterium]|nr:hypothetical protein [Halanaerobiales bacterium]
MEKRGLFITGFVICLLTLGFVADTYARDIYYWDDMMEKAAIQTELNQMEMSFQTKFLEFYAGEMVKDSLDLELGFNFGILKNGEINGYLSNAQGNQNVIVNYRQKLRDRNGFIITGQLQMYETEEIPSDFYVPGLKILTDKRVNENLTLHNHWQVFFLLDSKIVGMRLENGFIYQADEKNSLQVKLKTFFTDDITKSELDLRAAYKHIVNEQTNYILFGYFNPANLHIENIVEFQMTPTLKLIGDMGIRTNGKNWISVQIEKAFSEGFRIRGEYQKEADGGAQSLRAGLDFEI